MKVLNNKQLIGRITFWISPRVYQVYQGTKIVSSFRPNVYRINYFRKRNLAARRIVAGHNA